MKMINLSGEIFSAILNSIAESFVLISPTHEVMAFNASLAKNVELFFDHKIQVGDDYRDYVADPLKDVYYAAFQKALGGEVTLSQKLTSTNHYQLWIEYRVTPVLGGDQNIVGVAVCAKNIDEQKKAELAIEKLRTNYESLLNNISDSICLIDPHFKIIQFNKHIQARMFEHLGKTMQIGEDVRQYLFPNETDKFFTHFDEALKGKTVEEEICIRKSNGEAMWILSKMYPVFDKNHSLVGICLVAINISSKKKLEVAIQENEIRFRKIIETAPIPIIIIDKSRTIQFANPEAEKVFNYQPNELINKELEILIPDGLAYHLSNSLKKGLQSQPLIHQNNGRFSHAITKDGIEKIVEISTNSFQVNDETFVLAILQDITKRIEHEQKLENQVEALEKIAWQQSHEIRRPVANILGLVQLIEYDEEYNPMLINQLHHTARELDDVIHKIVTLTHTNR